ncbi:MAG: hypothetical protein AABX51_03790 [Nanoarchaeota archaeon]
MNYAKEAPGLTQNQAIDNLREVFLSDYFKEYIVPIGGRIYSDMFNVESIGGWKKGTWEQFKAGDISDVVVALLDAIANKGTLTQAYFQMAPTEERLRSMNFEPRLYEHELDLPLSFSVSMIGEQESASYTFSVYNPDFRDSTFKSECLNLKDAQQKRGIWRSEITRNLKVILPHQVQA